MPDAFRLKANLDFDVCHWIGCVSGGSAPIYC